MRKNTNKEADSQKLCVDLGTRRDLRRYTYGVSKAAVDIYVGASSVQDGCLCALRVVDIMDESAGYVPLSLLTEFHDVIAASIRVLDGASRLLSDIRTNAQKLASVVYKLPDPFKVNNEETENN